MTFLFHVKSLKTIQRKTDWSNRKKRLFNDSLNIFTCYFSWIGHNLSVFYIIVVKKIQTFIRKVGQRKLKLLRSYELWN